MPEILGAHARLVRLPAGLFGPGERWHSGLARRGEYGCFAGDREIGGDPLNA